jgi:gliding motility-associated-like protein
MKRFCLFIVGILSIVGVSVFAQVPTITSINPLSGKPGDTITLSGTNFSPNPVNNTIFFGSVVAPVIFAGGTTLKVITPVGAIYAPVTNNIGGLQAISKQSFNPVFSPCSAVVNTSTFSSKVDFGSASAPQNIVVGDINLDGKNDLILGNMNGNSISVLRNTSTIGVLTGSTFATKVDFATSTSTRLISVGDMDGDGRLDIIAPCYSGGVVSVLRNTTAYASSTINFATKTDFNIAGQGFNSAVGDLDGDGKLDMVICNYNTGNISVFRNTSSVGNISFSSRADYTTGSTPVSVDIADYDGDGKPEVIVANAGAGTLSIFRNISTSGTITLLTKYDISIANPTCVKLWDLDGDNKRDVVITNGTSPTGYLSVYRNISSTGTINSSSFSTKQNFAGTGTPQFSSIGDIDGDNKPDVITPNSVSSFSVFRNTSTSGAINFASAVNFTTASTPTGSAVADIDNDYQLDVEICSQGSSVASVFRNLLNNKPYIRLGNDTTYCTPTFTRTLDAGNTGSSYLWQPSLQTSQTITISSSGIYSVKVTMPNGCFDYDTINIGHNASFTPNLVTNDTSICLKDSILLVASGGGGYLWRPSIGITDTTSASTYAKPTTNTLYKVIITSGVCSYTDSLLLSVKSIPTANAGSDVYTCLGDSSGFVASAFGGTVFWSPGLNFYDSTNLNSLALITNSREVILKVLNSNGCVAYDTAYVNIINNCCNTCSTPDSTNLGLVACYPLNVDAKDYGGSGFNGTLMAGPSLVSGHSGDSTAAYSFNGTSQYIRLGDILDTLFTKANTKFTVSGWARTTTVTSVSGGGIIVGKAAGTASQWQIYHDNDGRLKATVYTAADASKLVEKKSNVMAAGQWFHFVLVFDGTQSVDSNKLQFYVNNQAGVVSRLLGAPIGNTTANTAQEITIGAGHVQGNAAGITNSYNGRVDEVRFYNQALSGYEVGRLFIQKEKPNYSPLSDAYLCLGDSIQLMARGASVYRWVAGEAISDTTVSNPYVKPTVTNNYILNARNLNLCSIADTITVNVQNNCCLNCLAETSINNSLKACLPFDGSVTDKSINANTGTVSGGATLTSDRKGVASKAYDFNGTNAYISYANSSSLSAPNTMFTFSAWVSIRGWTNILGNNIAPIMAKSNSSSTAQYGVALTDKGITVINNGKIWSYTNLSSSFNLNQWYHIAVVANNNQVQLYIDGNLTATFVAPSGTFTSSTSNPLTIGKSDPGLTGYFNGKLDEIHLYDRALSAADVVTLFLGKDLLQTTVRNDTTICMGQTVLLGANGATAYTWSPGQFLNDSTIATPIATITDSTRFTLKSTDGNCLKRDTVKVHVNFVTPVISNDTTICEQTSTTLLASGGTLYAWTPAAGLSATNIANPVASPSISRTYKVTLTKLGCTAQDSVTVTVRNKFVPTVTNDTLLCPVYANLPLSASGPGVISYLWTPGNVVSDSNIAGPVAFPAYTTKFKVTMSDGICTIIDSVTVTRDTSLRALASNDTTICEQNSVQLTATGGTSYSWSPSAGLSSVSVFNPVATPGITRKYYVDVSDAFCTLRDSVTVTIKNKFVPVVSNDTNICKGSSLQLYASGTGVISYRWRPATYLNDSTSATPVTTPVTNMLYHVVMSDGICLVTDSVLIIRDTLLISSTSNDTTICKGDTVQLFASGGLFYQWSSPGTLNYANIPNPVSYATSTLKYYVDVSDNKCTVRDSVLLTVINFNKVVAPKDTNLCKGDSVLLAASGTGSYTWIPTLGLADPYNKLTKASPPFTTTYVIKTNTLGCITYDTVVVSVQTQVASLVTTTQDTTICQGDTAVIQAASSEPATTFTWNTGAKTPLIVVKPTNSTWYKVNTKVGSCVGSSDSTFVTVLARPKAKFSINPADSGNISFNAEFKNQSTNATDFEYFFGDSFNVYGYTPDTNYIYTYPGTFVVKLKVFNQNPGCADSALMAVKVKDIVSIFIPNAFSPNKDGVNDTFRVVMTGVNRCYGIIFDRWGEEIYTQRSSNGSFEWDGTFRGEFVQIGVYYYTLQYFEESKKRWYTITGEIHVIE